MHSLQEGQLGYLIARPICAKVMVDRSTVTTTSAAACFFLMRLRTAERSTRVRSTCTSPSMCVHTCMAMSADICLEGQTKYVTCKRMSHANVCHMQTYACRALHV